MWIRRDLAARWNPCPECLDVGITSPGRRTQARPGRRVRFADSDDSETSTGGGRSRYRTFSHEKRAERVVLLINGTVVTIDC